MFKNEDTFYIFQSRLIRNKINTEKTFSGIKSILENNNFVDKLYLYDNNGCEVLISADGSRINTSDEDGIEIVSLEDVPDPESEELF